jgi:hypothetical protein
MAGPWITRPTKKEGLIDNPIHQDHQGGSTGRSLTGVPRPPSGRPGPCVTNPAHGPGRPRPVPYPGGPGVLRPGPRAPKMGPLDGQGTPTRPFILPIPPTPRPERPWSYPGPWPIVERLRLMGSSIPVPLPPICDQWPGNGGSWWTGLYKRSPSVAHLVNSPGRSRSRECGKGTQIHYGLSTVYKVSYPKRPFKTYGFSEVS